MNETIRAGQEHRHPAGRGHDLPARFPPPDRTLPVILTRQAQVYRDRPLFVSGETVWSYAEAAEVAASSALVLARGGVERGDRVAIICSNRFEFMQVYLGCAWLGAVAVPINTASRGMQLSHILSNSGARLLVIEAALLPAFGTLSEPPRALERVWTIGEVADGDAPPDFAAVSPLPPLAEPLPPADLRPGDTVAILYTSGTTGPSKGVRCPQAQMFWWGANTGKALGLYEGDVLFTALPLFHTNALNTFYQALLHGCRYVLEPKFSASRFWPEARRRGATVTYLLGAMAAILLSRPEGPDDRAHAIRVALGGGVPERFHAPFRERFGVALLDGYGSTETNLVFASPVPSDHPGTMGYLVDGMEARIVDDDDAPVPDGEAGELIVRSREPFAFATGYHGMDDKTVEAWRNLWFHTGDRVVRESDGHYRFIDRMKDAIRRRGENISSWEVEQALLAHPAIASCAAYPVPSDLGEDEVMAAIQLEPGAALDSADLVEHCRTRLASFAVPRFVRFVAELPLTENGKVRKVALREQGVTPDSWDREAQPRRTR